MKSKDINSLVINEESLTMSLFTTWNSDDKR